MDHKMQQQTITHTPYLMTGAATAANNDSSEVKVTFCDRRGGEERNQGYTHEKRLLWMQTKDIRGKHDSLWLLHGSPLHVVVDVLGSLQPLS